MTLISIVGPTGSGKTDFAVRLACELGRRGSEIGPAPIISTDSRQVYRGMAIGTAQPTTEQQRAVTHYFIADRDPNERFTCADFEREAMLRLKNLFTRHEYVVAVGGSGLYIDALCNGLDTLPDIDPEIRNELARKLLNEGLKPLLEELRRLDPVYYGSVDRHNPPRVLRALEVCRQTGVPFSSLRTGNSVSTKTKVSRPFDIIKIGIDLPRNELYARIDRRVDEMMTSGLEAEARILYPMRHLPALQTVGYRELNGYFNGEYSLERAVELIKRNSRRYAKRQLTWFRRDDEIRWFHPIDLAGAIEYITRKS